MREDDGQEVDAEIAGQKLKTRNVRLADIVLAVLVLYLAVWKPFWDEQRKECPSVGQKQ